MPIKDLTGMVVHRWTVLSFYGLDKRKKSLWTCTCSCGTLKEVSGNSLSMGKTQSCGCLVKEVQSARLLNNKIASIHGLSKQDINNKTRLYRIWCGIKNRITNPNVPEHPRYGGKGVKICNEWMTFTNFHEWAINNGYSENLTIDRVDVEGNYEPNNCRWVSSKAQANNRSNNVWYTIDGKEYTQTQLAEKNGISPQCLNSRLKRGWSLENAIKPVKYNNG